MINGIGLTKGEENKEVVWYKSWWGILIAIFFFPFFIIWYVWARSKLHKVLKVIITVIVGIIFISALVGDNSSPMSTKTTSDTKSTPAPVTTPAATATKTETPVVSAVTYKEAISYKKGDQTWKLIVFSKKPSDDELKKAALDLHLKDKTSNYDLFDDNTKIEDYKNWDINYGKVMDKDGVAKLATDCIDISYCVNLVKNNDDAYKYPKEWADQHYLGLINQMYSGGTAKWQLSNASGEKLLDL